MRTIIAPQPALITGADGAVGNTTAFIVVSWHKGSELIAFAGIVPHADVNLYLALIVQQPAVLTNKLFT